MLKRNILDTSGTSLEYHRDSRGSIVDIFYNEKIEHVTLVTSNPDSIRGNHYHKQTTQHMLMMKGSLEYWYKPTNSTEDAKMVEVFAGDIITTEPNEIHALKIGSKGNQFIVFTEGLRGGMDYESDTYRVENIING